MNTGKAFYYSKTFWANIIGVAAMMGQSALGFDIGAEYQVAALALVNLALRAVTKGPVDWGKLGNIVPVVFLLLIMPLTFSMQGCAVTTALIDDHTLVAELGTRAATGRILEERPSWIVPTYHITGDAIRLMDADDTISLEGLQQFVVDQIPWANLTPEEQALLTTLISAVRVQMEQELADKGVVDPGEVTVRATMVLTWIHQTAKIRLPKITDTGGAPALACSLCTDKGSSLRAAAQQQEWPPIYQPDWPPLKFARQQQQSIPADFSQIVDDALDEASAVTDAKFRERERALTYVERVQENRQRRDYEQRAAAAEAAWQRASERYDRINRERMQLLFTGDESGADALASQSLQAEQQVDNCLSIAMGVWLSPASL